MSSSLVGDFQSATYSLGKRIRASQNRESKISKIRDAYGLSWKNPIALSMNKPGGLPLCAGADGRPKPSSLRNCTNADDLKPSLLVRFVFPNINIPSSRVQGHKRTHSS